LVFVAACNPPHQNKEFQFIVSSFNKPSDPKEPPPPPMPEYAPFNFILDTSGQVYYYQLQFGKPKCASVNDDDLTPPFIGLKPENIVQVSQSNLADFVSNNILYPKKDYKYVSIACLVDTVKSNALKKLIDIFKDRTHKTTYSIRRITQEERIVLDYKKRQIHYDPDSIAWDSSRIRFTPKLIVPKIIKD
jgi:hypothetical protein